MASPPGARIPITLGRAGPGASPTGAATRPLKRVYVEQYGCATTQGEAQQLRGLLEARGHTLVPRLEDADTALIVTCTVIERTERTMLKRIREFEASGREVVVSGCMASSQVDRVKEASPSALVLPPQYVHQVGELIEQGVVDFCYQPKVGLPKVREGVVETVVVNEGCSGKCTFCITKLARPGLRSYPVDGIVRDVRAAVEAGAREVRLTSQDLGAWGLDRGLTLPDLLREVLRVPGDYRVRLGMLNPFTLEHVVDGLEELLGHPRLYRFLHLPIQSGSDRVLEHMRRAHRTERTLEYVERLRRAAPDLHVSTDVICGYPTETDEDHEATKRALHRLRPESVNVTRFSPREGTPAAELKPLQGSLVRRRSRELTALRWELALAERRRFLGSTFEAFVTEPGKPGTCLARTDAYRQLAIAAQPLGARVRVRVTEVRPHDMLGEVVGP